jgi:hypothetical protein
MKLVSRKVPKTLEDETVSLLPEDPEDMVSSPCYLLPSKFIPLVWHVVFPLSTLRPCFDSYCYPSPSNVVTPSAARLWPRYAAGQHSPYTTCLAL